MPRNTTRAEHGQRVLTREDRGGSLFVQSVEKAMGILSAFHHADGPLTLSELANLAEIDRSAAQRMVHTLRTLGYIRRDAERHGFLPGLRILDHTLDYLRLDPLVRQSMPVLQELRKSVRERVDLSLFDGPRVVYAVRLQTTRQTLNASLVGHSVPSFCSSGGWAMLSRLSPETARDIVEHSDRRPFTSETITEVDDIMARIAQTRADGYALTVNQILSGEIAAAFPVMNSKGEPLAAIHIAGSLADWTPQDYARRVVPLGQQAARTISQY
ncbi:MAG: IclR family transcriptional regulator [Paracoccaceae bacterium]|nr:IclR family transcriptional regulator [Paracoccaceae bacterium]